MDNTIVGFQGPQACSEFSTAISAAAAAAENADRIPERPRL